jgi:hypothetical protein
MHNLWPNIWMDYCKEVKYPYLTKYHIMKMYAVLKQRMEEVEV